MSAPVLQELHLESLPDRIQLTEFPSRVNGL